MDAPVVALTNARVIDGTGAPVRPGQTIVVVNGAIEAIGPSATTTAPAGARILDLAGKSVMPGLVMVHEHFYYPTGPGVYGQLGQSFVRLYLAGGVTTIRTAGNLNGYMDITLKRRVEAGEVAGPAIDATMPYVNGPNQFVQMTARAVRGARPPARRLLGRRGRHVGEGLHADLPGGARHRHPRGARPRDEGHRAPLLDHLRRGRGARHRQPRARLLRRHRLRRRQGSRCLSGAGPRAAGDCRPRSPGRAVPGAGPHPGRSPRRRDLHADRVRAQHSGPADAAGTRRAGPAAARAVPAEPGPGRSQRAVDLPAALPQGDGPRAGVRPRRRPAHRRHRPHRRRRGHPRLCQPPAARTAGRSGVHAARGDPDRHVERRPLSRARRAASARSRRASRPTSWWWTAILRRRSPTSGR